MSHRNEWRDANGFCVAPEKIGVTQLDKQFLRRTEAAAYLKERYGHGSPRTLAKLATLGGGPVFRRRGRIPLYTVEDLDQWALEGMSAPVKSTSELRAA